MRGQHRVHECDQPIRFPTYPIKQEDSRQRREGPQELAPGFLTAASAARHQTARPTCRRRVYRCQTDSRPTSRRVGPSLRGSFARHGWLQTRLIIKTTRIQSPDRLRGVMVARRIPSCQSCPGKVPSEGCGFNPHRGQGIPARSAEAFVACHTRCLASHLALCLLDVPPPKSKPSFPCGIKRNRR